MDESLAQKMGDASIEEGGRPTASIDIKSSAVADTSPKPSSIIASLRDKPPGPVKTPFVDPAPSAKPKDPAQLAADQQKNYDSLLKAIRAITKVPSTAGKGGPVVDSERMWLTRECLLRYLRATKWNTAEAEKRILGTLTWRRDYGVEGLTADHISPENETGKQLILGFDVSARPCLYLSPGNQNTEASPRQVQHLVFMVERVIDLMVPNQETLALLINFKASKSRSNTAPNIGQGREVLSILQTHYPERLGRSIIINIPWVVSGFFKIITPFIDPLTREKLKFNVDARLHVPPEQLLKSAYGGDVDFDYDHSVYWPALNKLCEERHEEQMARWIKAGRKIGESESYLKGSGAAMETAPESEPMAVPAPVVDEKGKVSSGPVDDEETETKAPLQTIASQSNGNKDLMAITSDPKLTTEGDQK